MGLLERAGDIIASNINALLDKAEDPVKTANYYMEKYMEELRECREETAVVAAQAKARKREMEQAQADVDKLSAMAMRAVQAGNDDDARVILQRKQAAEQRLSQATEAWKIADAQSRKLIDVYNTLCSNIETCRAKVQSIQATSAIAKNQEKVAGIMAKYGSGSKAGAKLDRMQEKAQARLDRAEALVDLGVEESDPLDLEAKYGGASSSVEDELARMKASLGT